MEIVWKMVYLKVFENDENSKWVIKNNRVFVASGKLCSHSFILTLRHDSCRKTYFLQNPCLRHNFVCPEHSFLEAAKTRFFLFNHSEFS